jgi:hypothetical protein
MDGSVCGGWHAAKAVSRLSSSPRDGRNGDLRWEDDDIDTGGYEGDTAEPEDTTSRAPWMINLSRKLLPRYPRTPVTTLTITAPPCPSPSMGCVGLP